MVKRPKAATLVSNDPAYLTKQWHLKGLADAVKCYQPHIRMAFANLLLEFAPLYLLEYTVSIRPDTLPHPGLRADVATSVSSYLE